MGGREEEGTKERDYRTWKQPSCTLFPFWSCKSSSYERHAYGILQRRMAMALDPLALSISYCATGRNCSLFPPSSALSIAAGHRTRRHAKHTSQRPLSKRHRPSPSVCRHPAFLVNRLTILCPSSQAWCPSILGPTVRARHRRLAPILVSGAALGISYFSYPLFALY